MNNRIQQLKQISTATFLEESNHVRYIFQGIVVCVIVLLGFLLWSSVATIKEVAVTYGEIEPEGYVQVVQHLEGGIVSKVNVRDGDTVTKGQILVSLDPTAKKTELNQVRSLGLALYLDQLRLNAFLNNQPADLNQWAKSIIGTPFLGIKDAAQIKKDLAEEKLQLDAQYKELNDQLSVLKQELEQRKEKLNQVLHQKQVWDEQVKLYTQQFNMYEQMKDKQILAQKDFLTILREMNAAKGESAKLLSEITLARQAIIEAENNLSQARSKFLNQAHTDLDTTQKKLIEVESQVARLQEQLTRMDVKAPISGIVKGLKVFPNNVIAAGGELLQIVPVNEQLVVTSRINTRDIGFIKLGSPASIKILTYDFARYGGIEGKVKEISASTFLDEEKRPYYKATITLDRQYLAKDEIKHKLLPGMTVEADIVTGQKTLLEYLLKPIKASAQASFHER